MKRKINELPVHRILCTANGMNCTCSIENYVPYSLPDSLSVVYTVSMESMYEMHDEGEAEAWDSSR